jgi:hypothetical protein
MAMAWFRRALAALCLLIIPTTAAQAEDVHYDIRAKIDRAGMLDAEVTITLPAGATGRDKAFLLGRRFTLQPVDAGPGATVAVAPTETPVDMLHKIDIHFASPGRHVLHFRYRGPLNPAKDDGITPLRPEGIELFLDHMWLPFGADIQTMFSADARIDGLAPDLVVVGQGKVTRTRTGVRIVRRQLDIDLPMVAMRGLKRVAGPGFEYYATDPTTPVSQIYVRHAAGASAYLQQWLGVLPDPIRLAAVNRARKLGYSRTAYTVVNDNGRPEGDNPEPGTARHVAHEFAHAWWRSASPLSEDFWLVESTAEYCALRYVEQSLGADAAKALIDAKRADAAKAGAIMGHGRPNRVQLYQKGPLLLIDLEQRIGRPAMDRLLRRVSDESRTAPNTTAEFLRALTEIGGADAAKAFNAALHAG